MRGIALTLALIVSVAGCLHRPIPVQDYTPSGFSEPLAVRLLPPVNRMLRFVTSEPAYVAIFEIVPDLGISMLYPGSGDVMARVFSAGFNTMFMPSQVAGRWYYDRAQYYTAAPTFNKPRYLYIIASKSPLAVEEIRRSPSSFRRTLGWTSFLANDLSGTLDDLERLVAGSLAEDEWSSDLYVIWPDNPPSLPWHTQYVLMRCSDGRVSLVPASWNIPDCPGSSNLAQATKPATPPGTIPDSDSTEPPEIGGPVGGGKHRPGTPRPLDVIPGGSPITRTSAEHARRPARADRDSRVERAPGAREPRQAPRSRPAPAPRQDAPRAEPASRREPQRSEPSPSAPGSREPAVPKEPAKP